ncbi:hypothetical protein PUMCH_004134 [Australozyma saopauloensis]|uniref:Major facilitator superfamily (MFS) profile domain-containing protein n=1 Tax=Australozyma saopauloensis TaxID=291208 RepID=A0AAX4HEE2_9ASCO|nr:hypothetical protein PUMCH_004134 [[Candida] saopauloensis]
MVYEFVKASFWGRVIYHLSGRTMFNYEEEQEGYILPDKYRGVGEAFLEGSDPSLELSSNKSSDTSPNGLDSEKEKSIDDGYILVEFDGEDDPLDPKNWSMGYKILFIIQLQLLTAFVYMASAIYTPGIEQIQKEMGIGHVLATLPLTLFVFGYAIGPMVFSPLSEDARYGRTTIYIVTLFIFFILQIPTALVNDIASLCVLRFIAGFFASPCLATGGASFGDITRLPWMPVTISLWGIAAVCAPSLGPLIGAAMIEAKNYHWTFWFVCFSSGASLVFLSWFLPETYAKTILYRKAERLRALTGNDKIVSQGHLDNQNSSLKTLLFETLYRPFEIVLFEPVVLMINVYIGLVYSVMYLWFEAFPIVFLEIYKFTLVQTGAAYIALEIGIFVGATFFIPMTYRVFTKKLLNNQPVYPEVFIPTAIVGGVLMPVGMFIFGWTSTSSVHWIAPMIGTAIFAAGAFIIFQTLFNYLSMSFPSYLASVFAGNALFRSMMAGAFPLFGRALFVNLLTPKYPVAWGTMVLAIACVLMIAIPVLFYLNGPKLRARSKYAS